jgi:hypothetical protein
VELSDGKHALIDSRYPADVPIPSGAPRIEETVTGSIRVRPKRDHYNYASAPADALLVQYQHTVRIAGAIRAQIVGKTYDRVS